MPDLRYEHILARTTGAARIAGIDEVGRGPLAGPVVAAAVMIEIEAPPFSRGLRGRIDDSKKLDRDSREEVAEELLTLARAGKLAIGVGAASVTEIDKINILQASFLAMRRALRRMPHPLGAAIVDGNRVPPNLGCQVRALIDADALCLTVAAASIVAKVVRDRAMRRLATRYDAFGWHTNVGYSTEFHLEALARCGPTPHHRLSFAPVAQGSLNL